MSNASIKAKVTIQDLCNAKKVSAEFEEKKISETVVGIIYGRADDIVVRAAPDGSKNFEGLRGIFEIVPADPAREPVQSAICYLPDFVFPQVRGMLYQRDASGADVRTDVKSVKFGFEVSLIAAKNPQGYSWKLNPKTPPTADDPVDVLRKEFAPQLAVQASAQLTDQSKTADTANVVAATPKTAAKK